MKINRISLILLIVLLFSLPFFVGCSTKPSNTEIEEAIRSELQTNFPFSWENFFERERQLKTIEIKELGAFNKKNEYWPVKSRVVWTVLKTVSFNKSPELVEKEKNAAFIIRKDDFGKWKASLIPN